MLPKFGQLFPALLHQLPMRDSTHFVSLPFPSVFLPYLIFIRTSLLNQGHHHYGLWRQIMGDQLGGYESRPRQSVQSLHRCDLRLEFGKRYPFWWAQPILGCWGYIPCTSFLFLAADSFMNRLNRKMCIRYFGLHHHPLGLPNFPPQQVAAQVRELLIHFQSHSPKLGPVLLPSKQNLSAVV